MDVRWVRYGDEAADALRDAVDAAKAGGPLASVTVVVPSNYVGVASRRALARRTNGVAAVTFLTIYRLAELLGAGTLAATGRRPVSNPVLAAGVRHALGADAGCFAPVASHPATEAALVDAYAELRQVDDAGLDAISRLDSRPRDVIRLHRRARSHLEDAWYDEQDLLAAATDAVRDATALASSLGAVVVHLPQRITPHAGALLAAIGERTSLTVLAGTTGDERADADVIASLGRLGATTLPPRPDAPASAALPIDADRTRILTASDADDEVRAAVRAVVAAVTEGTPLERIAILHASPDPYARLVHERLAAADVPSNGAAVVPLAARAFGRTVLHALAVPDHGYRRDDLLGLLAANVLHDGRDAPTQAWERASRDAGVVAGRGQWDTRLEALAADLDAEATSIGDDPDDDRDWLADKHRRDAGYARSLRAFALGLIDELERAARAPRRWRDHAAWAARLAERLLGGETRRGTWPDVERDAANKVLAALDRLRGLDDVEGAVALDVFRRTLELELERDLGRVGRFGEGVLVGPIGMGIGLDLDLVVVLGLAEGTFPAKVTDDGLLPDDERAVAGGELPLRRDRVEREHRELLASLAGARHQLLCLPRGDLRRSAERVPSRWLLDIASALAERRLWTDDLLALDAPWLEHVASFASGVGRLTLPADEHEHRLRALTDETEGAPLARAATVAGDDVLRAGVTLFDSRRSNRFTRFDGNLGGLGLDLPSPIDGVVSATRVQTWAKCPHRYFVQYVLGIEPVERPEDELEITPIDRGKLVHRILDRFIAEVLGRPEADQPSPDDRWTSADYARLRAIALEECGEDEQRGITGRDLFWRRDRTRLLAELDRFLHADDAHRAATATRPIATELHFTDVRLAVAGGGVLTFRGAADRIDVDADGTLHIVDYKTGSARGYQSLSADDPDSGGTLLQLAVYGVAARAHHGESDARVVAEYWFTSDKGGFGRVGYEVTDDVLDLVSHSLRAIVDGIAAGVFPAHPTNESTNPFIDCWFCDPDGLGVTDRRREWDSKRGDPSIALFVDLAEPRIDGETDDG